MYFSYMWHVFFFWQRNHAPLPVIGECAFGKGNVSGDYFKRMMSLQRVVGFLLL